MTRHPVQESKIEIRQSGSDRKSKILPPPLLIAALLLAYQPAWRGAPIWDDDAHLTRPELCSWAGLARIWAELGATQQYYPVTHTAFWLQHWLWGENFLGYHLVNIFLHAFAALLLVAVLRGLKIRGAWLAAALWALHPVQVESVAWMSELKNTLSGVCYLAAALLYLRFQSDRSRSAYLSAFGLFILGLLTKSVIATLPVALLVVFYWKYGRLRWRRDVRPLIPFFSVGIVSGLFTAWVERSLIGANGTDFRFSLLERGLIAGRAFWFYLGKLIWPADLIFIYPRWNVSSSVWWQFSFPVSALALFVLLFWKRIQWGRAPLAALLFFVATLFPALGFLNIYPFRYSFVADHFQYLAAIGPIVLFAACVTALSDRLQMNSRLVFPALSVALVAFLGFLTWKQSARYAGQEILYRTTLARNPGCWMARNNLGRALLRQGRSAEAIADYREALRIDPDYADARCNLGIALLQQGRAAEAVSEFRQALRINPDHAEARNNLGTALLQQGRAQEAISQYREAVRINPAFADARYNLGNTLAAQGRPEEAIAQFREVLRIRPAHVDALFSLGNALFQQGRIEEAAAEYRESLKINPANWNARNNLGSALLRQGRTDDAVAQFREAVRIAPDHAETHNNLGNALLQNARTDEAVSEFRDAIRIFPDYADAHYNLGNALARQGKMEEASSQYRETLRIDPGHAEAHGNLGAALIQSGRIDEAITHLQLALDRQPADLAARNNLAWILATAPQESLRDAAKALRLATEDSQSAGENPLILRTLAAAYAATGEYSKAAQTAQTALQLAESQSNPVLAAALRRELNLYQSGKPYEASH